MHRLSDPAILYFGTPVVLVSSRNEDRTANVAPMSSAWWLGRSCLLGFGARSKTPANILRTGECVLNLPSIDQVAAVNKLARTTGEVAASDHELLPVLRSRRDPPPLDPGRDPGRRLPAEAAGAPAGDLKIHPLIPSSSGPGAPPWPAWRPGSRG